MLCRKSESWIRLKLKNDVVKKDVYIAKIKDIEDKIPDITNVETNATLNAKINEVNNEIPNITILDTNNTAVTAAENIIPDHSKYISTLESKRLIAENFTARLKQANLATKDDIADFVKTKSFDDKLKKWNKKVTFYKSKHLLIKSEFKKLQDEIENW